jgi:hypothetical protein
MLTSMVGYILSIKHKQCVKTVLFVFALL